MGNRASKKRNCEICDERIHNKSGKEIVRIEHADYCSEKTSDRAHIHDLKIEISQAEKRVAFYQTTYATEVSKLKNQHIFTCRTKDSEIQRLETRIQRLEAKIKNQTTNLNGIGRRHEESLHKTKELVYQVSQLQRRGLIKNGKKSVIFLLQ